MDTTNVTTEAYSPELLAEALSNCAREPIHQIGTIQPGGVLVALRQTDLVVHSVSANVGDLFDFTPDAVLGQSLDHLIGEASAAAFRELIAQGKDLDALHWSIAIARPSGEARFDAQVFLAGGLWIIEIECQPPALSDPFYDVFIPIRDALWKLDSEMDLQRYTQAVVDQVRVLTDFDRVMMYRFDSNWDGEVVAEAKGDGVGSYLGNRFPASDIPAQARELYVRNLVRLLADVEAMAVPLLVNHDPTTGQPVDLSLSWFRSMSLVHTEYLRNMGVRASLSISLVQNGRLWGLIACHHLSPKYVSLRAREQDEFIGRVVSLKLTNMDDRERGDLNRRSRDVLFELIELIRHSMIPPDTAIVSLQEKFLGLARADGGIVSIDGRRHAMGETPDPATIESMLGLLRTKPRSAVFHTERLSELFVELPGRPDLRGSEKISGMMVAPLDHEMRNFVMWFRLGVVCTLRWAGRPAKRVVREGALLRISPRESFETWIETYRDRSISWSQVELDAASSLSLALIEALTQKALKSSEESYRLLAENSTDMIARLDLDGTFRFVSLASRELLGVEPETLLGQGLQSCVLDTGRDAIRRVLESLTATGMQATTVVQGQRNDGRLLWVEATCKRTPGTDGRDELLMNARDVTQRHTYQLAIEEVHRRNALILDAAGEGLISLDQQGRIVYVNEVALRILGCKAEVIVGTPCCELLCGPDANGQSSEEDCPFLATLADGETRQGNRLVVDAQGGRPITVSFVCTPLVEGSVVVGSVVVFSEATAVDNGEGKLATEVMLNQAMEAVMVTDIQGCITSVNRAFTEITGYSMDDVRGRTPRILRSGVHTANFYDEFWRALRDRQRWVGEIWNRRKNGEIYPQWGSVTAVRDREGKVQSYVAVFSDISKAKQAEEKLYYLANHDALTGLPNRMQFSEQLSASIERARASGGRLAVAFIDLDRFKIVNDTLGHDIGDSYLQRISERLLTVTRKRDVLARWGGDEFVLSLEGVEGPEAVGETIGRLLSRISEPMFLEGHELIPTLSVGISVYPSDGATPGDLIKAADSAMYRAKGAGRNRFQFYTESMTEELNEKFGLAGELRRALQENELILHYQPQISAISGALVGVEALSRWQHPGRGLLGPAHFIPMADELGMICELGDWVLRQACQQMRDWIDRGIEVPRIAINVAPAQLTEGFVKAVKEVLRQYDLPPPCLELEITEGALEAGVAVRQITSRLRDLGVLLSVDDFGTGYSSLSHIKFFPITCFKIDKSFVDGIPDDEADVAIIRAILALGASLHVEVVAEGVETAAQAAFLSEAGVTNIQGFYYGQPMPPHLIEAFIFWRNSRLAESEGLS
jgi:diguanylate cyclase (GGDEF)-like protein/PAS domain S-box-containing protein